MTSGAPPGVANRGVDGRPRPPRAGAGRAVPAVAASAPRRRGARPARAADGRSAPTAFKARTKRRCTVILPPQVAAQCVFMIAGTNLPGANLGNRRLRVAGQPGMVGIQVAHGLLDQHPQPGAVPPDGQIQAHACRSRRQSNSLNHWPPRTNRTAMLLKRLMPPPELPCRNSTSQATSASLAKGEDDQYTSDRASGK